MRRLSFIVRALVVCLSAFLHQQASSQTILYSNTMPADNTYGYTYFNYGLSSGYAEAGNEVLLTTNTYGSASTNACYITQAQVQFDFESENVPSGTEAIELNFYQNDGPPFGGSNSPGTLIWSSGFVTTSELGLEGDDTPLLLIYSPNVFVPPDFTWTLVYSNLPSGEMAGLTLCSPADAGQTDGFAWLNLGTAAAPSWSLNGVSYTQYGFYPTPPQPILAAGAVFAGFVNPQAGAIQAISMQTNGTILLELAGTAGAPYTLSVSTDLTNWTPMATLANIDGTTPYTDSSAGSFPARFYRLALQGATPSAPALGPPFYPPYAWGSPNGFTVCFPGDTLPITYQASSGPGHGP